MKPRNKDYSFTATWPAGTGTLVLVATRCNAKTANQTQTASKIFNPPTKPIQLAKQHIKIATWNVRSLIQPVAKSLLATTLKHHQIAVACIQETRHQETESTTIDDANGAPCYKLYNSCYEDSQGLNGVAIVIDNKLVNHVMEWKPVNARLCYMRIHASQIPLSLICANASTEDADADIKEAFYNDITNLIQDVNKKDIAIIGEDMNAKLGTAHPDEKSHIGRFSTGTGTQTVNY